MRSRDPVPFALPSSSTPPALQPPYPTTAAALLAGLLVLAACAAHVKAQAFDPAAYQASYTPTVIMTVIPAVLASPTNAVTAAVNQAAATVPLLLQGSVFTQTPLPLNGSGHAATATFTLNYGAAWAGQTVYVTPLRGGTCTATGAAGSATFHHGFLVTLDATGSTVMTFRPPDKPGTYKVFTRLLNVSTTFPFVVPDTGS